MNEKLDSFLPSLEVITSVKRQLINAGVDPDAIPEDWLVATIAAMTKWQCRTSEGMKFVVNLMGFQWKRGLDEQEYEYYHAPTGETYLVPPEKVHFFAGAAISGTPVNPADILIREKGTETCEGCSTGSHCVKDRRDHYKDRSERLCNYCASLSDNPYMRQEASYKICEHCTKARCTHHPQNRRRLLTGT